MPTQNRSTLIDLIHDTPFNPGLWVEVIERLNEKIGADTGLISDLDISTGKGAGVPVRQDPAIMDDYNRNWAGRNPLIMVDDPVGYTRDWQPMIMQEGEWIDRDVLRATAYYNEFLRPIGAEHGLFLRLGLTGAVVSAISIARREARGAFQMDEVEVARRYHPHMVQAIRTARRLNIDQEALDQFDMMLESTEATLIFLDHNLRVRRMTTVAEQRLLGPGILRIVNGRIELPDAAQNAQLLERLGASVRGETPSSPLIVASRRGAPSIELRVTPLGPRSMAAHSNARFILLSATEHAGSAVDAIAFDWRASFLLTPAEARVASLIAEGLNVRDTAGRLGISIHTVRAQLGTVFSKTGTHRQADLVRLQLKSGVSRA